MLAVVSVVIFGVVQVLPGDVATMILGTSSTPEDLATLRERLGLTRPAPLRYVDWVSGTLRGDWGTSLLYKVPVRPLVLDRLRQSALLAALAMAVAVPLSIALGVLSAVAPGTLRGPGDQPGDAGGRLAARVRVGHGADPGAGVLVAGASAVEHGRPARGFRQDGAGLVLPVLTLVLGLLAHMTRMVRASMIEALDRPFVRAARLRGLRPRLVIFRHALRNALLPTVGIVAINIGYLIGGIFVVETVFAYPGLGRLMVDAVSHRDVP